MRLNHKNKKMKKKVEFKKNKESIKKDNNIKNCIIYLKKIIMLITNSKLNIL